MLSPSLKDLDLSSEKSNEVVKSLARKRGIKGYKSMPDNKLLSALKASEGENNRIEKIRDELKKLAHKISKSEIKEIRKSPNEIENRKDLFASREKEIKENLLELENKLSRLKKYYDNDNANDKDEYKGRRSIRNLFDLPIDEYYYKPIII